MDGEQVIVKLLDLITQMSVMLAKILFTGVEKGLDKWKEIKAESLLSGGQTDHMKMLKWAHKNKQRVSEFWFDETKADELVKLCKEKGLPVCVMETDDTINNSNISLMCLDKDIPLIRAAAKSLGFDLQNPESIKIKEVNTKIENFAGKDSQLTVERFMDIDRELRDKQGEKYVNELTVGQGETPAYLMANECITKNRSLKEIYIKPEKLSSLQKDAKEKGFSINVKETNDAKEAGCVSVLVFKDELPSIMKWANENDAQIIQPKTLMSLKPEVINNYLEAVHSTDEKAVDNFKENYINSEDFTVNNELQKNKETSELNGETENFKQEEISKKDFPRETSSNIDVVEYVEVGPPAQSLKSEAPSIEPSYQSMVNSSDVTERVRAATSGYGLDVLSKDENDDVRMAVVATGVGLNEFVNDKSENVREYVAKTGYGLDKLISDPVPEVSDAANDYLKEHNYNNLNQWIEENPDKCVLEENQKELIGQTNYSPTIEEWSSANPDKLGSEKVDEPEISKDDELTGEEFMALTLGTAIAEDKTIKMEQEVLTPTTPAPKNEPVQDGTSYKRVDGDINKAQLDKDINKEHKNDFLHGSVRDQIKKAENHAKTLPENNKSVPEVSKDTGDISK